MSRPASSRMIEVLPDSVGPSSTLRVPRSSVSETSRMAAMPSTERETCSSVNAHVRPPASRKGLSGETRWADIQSSMAAISEGVSRNPSLDRRHTMSSAVQAHSVDIRYLTSASVKLAPNDWPRSASGFRGAEQLAGARAVGMRQPVGMRCRQERIVAHQFRRKRRDRRDIHVAAGQRRLAGPAFARLGCRSDRATSFSSASSARRRWVVILPP